MSTTYTHGHTTIPTAMLTSALGSLNTYEDRREPDLLGTAKDLAHHLWDVLGGQPESDAHYTIEVNTTDHATTITLTVHAGNVDDEWLQLMQILAVHDAVGEFTHESSSGGDRWRTRLADRLAHEDTPVDAYTGDTIAYIGQLQRHGGLDYLTEPQPSHAAAVTALVTELRNRCAPDQPTTIEESELLAVWSARAGLAWDIHPIAAV